jgi:hypothetical protein
MARRYDADNKVDHYNDVDYYKSLLDAKLKGDAVQKKYIQKKYTQQEHYEDDTDEDEASLSEQEQQRLQEEKKERLAAVLSKQALGFHPPNKQEDENKGGGKRKSKGNSKKVSKKPVVSQKKQSIYKEILGKQMKIYKMPDSRKEYVKYKGDLLHISDYKDLMKQKAMVKTKVPKATRQKAKSKIQEIKYKNR